MTTITQSAGPARQRMWRPLIWVVAAAIVAAIAIAAWVVLTSDSTPTVTFDGENAVYDGPATFAAGEHTFVFDGSAYEADGGFAFMIGVIKDPTMTDADIKAYESEYSYRQPPFTGRGKIFWVLEDAEDRVLEETFLLDADTRYGIFVGSHDSPIHFAATFQVE